MKRKLKLAFCLFKYFPYGGLQVNFMNISKECYNRGYDIDVYTISWDGEKPDWLNITIMPVSGFSNHAKYQSFAKRFNERYNNKQYDAVVGFNKMPGLDVYYAADVLYAAKMKDRSFLHQMTNRYNTLIKLEDSVFRQDAKTQILLLTPKERQLYKDYYGTASNRF
ncbi:MAG: glycosyltransferase family 4 protein, partial [Desulfobacula sp.]|nr:glycosyltransferase family 4 protein [Desulfobacula sp.]